MFFYFFKFCQSSRFVTRAVTTYCAVFQPTLHLFFGLKNKQDEARERYKTRLTLPVIEVCNTSSNEVLRRFSVRKKIPSDRQSKGIIYAYELKTQSFEIFTVYLSLYRQANLVAQVLLTNIF